MTQSQSDSEQLTPENAVQRTRNLDAVAPGITVVKTLFALSGNQCYYPGCEELMTREGWQQVNGDIADICGEKPGAARYDEALGARVDDFENRCSYARRITGSLTTWSPTTIRWSNSGR